MWRIPSWTPESRLSALVLIATLAHLPACVPNDELAEPKITIVPAEAHPGVVVPCTLHSNRVNFSDCNDIVPESFTFLNDEGVESDEGIKFITVQNIEQSTETNTLQARIAINNTAIGQFDVAFACNSSTILTGSFNVTVPTPQPTFWVSPTEVYAGEQIVNLQFTAQDDFTFGNEIIQVDYIFDQGQNIPITISEIMYNPTISQEIANVTIDIGSWVTQQGGETSVDATVQVTTDSTVLRGILTIAQGSPATIWIEGDDTFQRPSSGVNPLEYSVQVHGENVFFLTKVTSVNFPLGSSDEDTPGVVANNINIINEKELTFDVEISDYAYIGATIVRVTTGDEDAETQMNIEAQVGDPVLELAPKEVSMGIADIPVLATAKNFDFDQFSIIECEEEGCDIDVVPIIGPTKQLVLKVSIDESFKPNNATVKVSNSASIMEVSETLFVADSQGTIIYPTIDNTLEQGTAETINIQISGDNNFASNSVSDFHILNRSGLKIDYDNSILTTETAALRFEVADDAPTGPALLQVEVGVETLEALLTVVESTDVPWVDVEPNWIAQGRRTATLQLSANSFQFDELQTSFMFDDPAFEVTKFVIDSADPHNAVVTVELSPVANSDMTVLYVKTGDDKAAASFRVLDVEKPRFSKIEPQSITRGDSGVELTITTTGSSFDTGAVFAEVMSGIGLEITDWSIDDTNNNIVHITVNAEATGPEGAAGIIIRNDWHTVVAPIVIVPNGSSTYDTTMIVEPSIVRLGSGPFELKLTIPGETPTQFSGFSEVFTHPTGTYSTLPDVESLDPKTATVLLDVGFDIDQEFGQATILATTAQGAVVGYVTIIRPSKPSLVEADGPWTSDAGLDEDWTAELSLNANLEPAMIYSSAGNSNFAGTSFEILSYNNLDAADPVSVEFFWGDAPPPPQGQPQTQRAIVSPVGSALSVPIDATVKSIIDDLDLAIMESGDTELSITSDPCDTPVLAWGSIDEALDEDKILLEGLTTCRLAVAVTARNIIDRPRNTPDICFKNNSGDILETGWPNSGDPDPTLYIDSGSTDPESIIAAELGSEGYYLVNIRRPYIIREINRSITLPYIVLEAEPGIPLDNVVIQLLDKDGLELESLPLSGLGIDADGIVVISGTTMVDADVGNAPVAIFPTDESFALRIFVDSELMDAVQIGTTISPIGEGEPIDNSDEFSTLKRVSGIDTNDNKRDFLVLWESSY